MGELHREARRRALGDARGEQQRPTTGVHVQQQCMRTAHPYNEYSCTRPRTRARCCWCCIRQQPRTSEQARDVGGINCSAGCDSSGHSHTTRLALHSTLFIPHCVSDLELAQPSTAVCALRVNLRHI